MGTAAVLYAARWVKALLFDVSPTDPEVFGGAVAVLLVTAVAASWLPVLRASRVDPNIALRSE